MQTELRREFHRQMDNIERDLVALGERVGELAVRSAQAFRDHDTILELHLITDPTVTSQCCGLRERCEQLLLLQAPVNGELRRVLTMRDVVEEFNGVATYAIWSVKQTMPLAPPRPPPLVEECVALARSYSDLMRECLQALVHRDLHQAQAASSSALATLARCEQITNAPSFSLMGDPRDTGVTALLVFVPGLCFIGQSIQKVATSVISLIPLIL